MMEYFPDIAAEWPRFADPPIPGVSCLHVTRAEEGAVLDAVFGGMAPGVLALFLTVEENTPFNRRMTFWVRNAQKIDPPAATWETSAVLGRKRKVALMALPTRDHLRWWRHSRAAPRFRHGLIVPVAGFELDELLADLVAADEVGVRGFLPWMTRAATAHGAMVMAPEDDRAGRPGFGVYGRPADVGHLRAILDAGIL